MKNTRKPLIIVSMALLLAVVLAMGGVTFAKYISTTGTRTNQANVAAWGFTMEVDATNLFNNNYKNGEAGAETLSVVAEDGKIIVSANADTNIVAPGSTGYMEFSIHGTSEVPAHLTIDSDYKDIVLKETGEEDYHPVKWTLTKDNAVVGSLQDVTLEAIETYIENMDEKIAPNTEYSLDGDYKLTWKWDFSTDAETDAKDTALGMFIANTKYVEEATGVSDSSADDFDIVAGGTDAKYAGTTTEIMFKMTITIVQIQEEVPASVAP